MIEPLLGDNERVAAFLAPMIWPRGWERFTAIGFMAGGELIAGVVYHNWVPEAGVIEMSAGAASPRWLTRKSLGLIFQYPFNQLGCQLVVLRVAERNERMRSIARRFGFTEYVIPRLRGPDEAECVYTLTKERWNEQRISAHPA